MPYTEGTGGSELIAPTTGTDVLVPEKVVLEKIEYFVNVQLWPRSAQPERWLDNFLDPERPYAVQLLNSFVHFNQEITEELFVSAFQLLSCEVLSAGARPDEAVEAWHQFRKRVLITPVQGENPSPADSGYLYAKKARDRLNISERQLVTHEDALRAVTQDATQPIIFVDDFVGTGEQFIRHWCRYVSVDGTKVSFASAAKNGMAPAYYCCALATEYGLERIADANLPVTVRAGNSVLHNASAIADDSLVWPASEHAKGVEVLRAANARAGIRRDANGFHGLGLTVAIDGRAPDATLPIFLWDKNAWTPLLRKPN